MLIPSIVRRDYCNETYESATHAGLDELIARLVAARVSNAEADFGALMSPSLRHLDHPSTLPDIDRACLRLARAVENREKIGVVTDYDVDGITSHTLLRESLVDDFGVDDELISGFIGHRLTEGYGLSDPVCERVLAVGPAVVITADCGSSDEPRIERLKAAGIDVIVTDHHGIPAAGVPASAYATVSPARAECQYPDHAIAGCTVAWLLMCHLRQLLIDRGLLAVTAPKLTRHLDLVSLGTVADAVSLFSHNNRALVAAGLEVLNRRTRPCWQALAELLSKGTEAFKVDDLGFQIGPRINARGRMEDPFAAWHFLAATNLQEARSWLQELDDNNQERRETEKRMVVSARERVAESLVKTDQVVVVYDDTFHAGVQGIVASRLLESFGRVTCVCSPGSEPGLVSGSLRSVPGVDVGAALKEVDESHPGLLARFGGHPAAAGVSFERDQLEAFRTALSAAVANQIGDVRLQPVILTDGSLSESNLSFSGWQSLQTLAPFGRGFDKPMFDGEFELTGVRAVGGDPIHLSLNLSSGRTRLRGIWFNALPGAGAEWPIKNGDRIRCVFELEPDTYRGGSAMQLMVRYAAPV
ncbi:MAG: single-stranded-DNA-specific exonuclease RecJ [Gammaproteobacteria bacterium]